MILIVGLKFCQKITHYTSNCSGINRDGTCQLMRLEEVVLEDQIDIQLNVVQMMLKDL